MSDNEMKMRAKVRVSAVLPYQSEGKTHSVRLMFAGVSASTYPEDGTDENNSFAKWSPSVVFDMQVTNPALMDAFAVGDTFYVDFTPAPK